MSTERTPSEMLNVWLKTMDNTGHTDDTDISGFATLRVRELRSVSDYIAELEAERAPVKELIDAALVNIEHGYYGSAEACIASASELLAQFGTANETSDPDRTTALVIDDKIAELRTKWQTARLAELKAILSDLVVYTNDHRQASVIHSPGTGCHGSCWEEWCLLRDEAVRLDRVLDVGYQPHERDPR